MMNKNMRPMGYPRRPSCAVSPMRPVMAGDLARNMAEQGGCENMPAMVFAEMQPYCNLYTPEMALCRGTLFAALDKPFCY